MRAEAENEYVDYVRGRLPQLHRAAYLLCGDTDRAQDIVQSTITALYRHWSRARAVENIDGYVHRMLVRRYLDEKRLSWSRVLLTDRTPDRTAPAQRSVEEQDAVHAALRRLPSGQRAVLVLRFLCDMSVEQTATALGCSEGNVKAQTSRGLATLRPLLGAEFVGGLDERN
ncbi:MAG: SigE family RNA polymerase sigma factor [Micromonosporaceae bacterium]|nr:SigE family RNA polymerase sigma factor [Micromonosporaceae bacterium]